MQPTMVTSDMRYWRIAPDPRLRGLVACYWAVDSEAITTRIRALEPTEDLLIPDGLSEIVFNRGCDGFDRWELGAREAKRHMDGSYVIGGRSRSVNTHAACALRLAGVKLDSRFLRAIIHTPLSEFRESTLPLKDLGDGQLSALEDSIANARCMETVIGLFDNFFLAAMRDLQRSRTAVDALIARIDQDHGNTPIMGWARQSGVDSRSLERAFCASMGMTPKQYARVIRFRRHYSSLIGSAGMVGKAGKVKPTLTSNLDGFFDQSHFNREFRHFTGVAPTTKLAGRMTQGMKVADHLLQV
jgi:AraC-like DNA-binding protein